MKNAMQQNMNILDMMQAKAMFGSNSLSGYVQTTAPVPQCGPGNKQKKECDMNVMVNESSQSTEVLQRKYLKDRARDIYSNKLDEIQTAFNIYADSPPHTAEDLVDRIKNGKFTLPTPERLKEVRYWSVMEQIDWRDPAKPADQAGADAAQKKLSEAYTVVKDDVMIAPTDKALESVRAFEAQAVN